MYRAIISGARGIVPCTAFDSGDQHVPLSLPFYILMADHHLPIGAPFSTGRSAVLSNELFSPWEMQGGRDTTLICSQGSPSSHCHPEVFTAFQQPSTHVPEGLSGDRLCAALQAAGVHPWAGRRAGKV